MIGFSTTDSISDTLLCGHLDKPRVLVLDSHFQIELSTRFRWREDGFVASYQGVTSDVTAKHRLPNSALGLTRRGKVWWPGKALSEKLGGDVPPASLSSYPINDQIWKSAIFPPYLWPDQNFDALFMTAATVTVTAFVDGLIDNVENVASSKKHTQLKTRVQKHTLFKNGQRRYSIDGQNS